MAEVAKHKINGYCKIVNILGWLRASCVPYFLFIWFVSSLSWDLGLRDAFSRFRDPIHLLLVVA